MEDQLKKYLFADRTVKLQTVHLIQAWQEALRTQSYPKPVRDILGQLCAATVLLAANIKFKGSLIMQIQGDGPVALVVVECNHLLHIRSTVKLRKTKNLPTQFNQLVNQHGNGKFVLTIMQEDAAPYQGIVALNGQNVAQVLTEYMKQSEQLDTQLWLAADHEKVAGLLLQKLPTPDGQDEAAEHTWQHVTTLAHTIQPDELLQLSSDALIHRLFWQEDLIALDSKGVVWHCNCTQERVADMLRSLGQEEVQNILKEHHQKIDIQCDFCGKSYQFNNQDCHNLFITH